MTTRLFILAVLSASLAAAGINCQLPHSLFSRRAGDLFDDARETDLGDAIADQIEQKFKVVEAPQETAFLSRLARQLLANAPATEIQFRFWLVDAPYANAFVLPGGRVYVTRKLIASLQSADELAAVIAHEMGHVLAHQESLAISTQMRRLLKITGVNSREEVFQDYVKLQDAYLHSTEQQGGRNHEPEDQIDADRVSVSLLVAAGYDPEALITVLDRITGMHGQYGNVFTDIFALTKPEGKRIRDLAKSVDRLPQECPAPQIRLQSDDVRNWQQRVLRLISHNTSDLTGLLSVRNLEPPLVSSMEYVHFSPDGKYALAQDTATIHVLSVSPFAPLFDIPAANTGRPQFSLDSAFISVVSESLRIERWDIAKHEQVEVHEIQNPAGCIVARLSPAGDLFACLQPDLTLKITRVGSGIVLYQNALQRHIENALQERSTSSVGITILADFLNRLRPLMEFSPDQSWLLLTRPGNPEDTLLVDLHEFKPVRLPIKAVSRLDGPFVFVNGNEVLARQWNKMASLIELPTGVVKQELTMPPGELVPLSDPRYILLRNSGKWASIAVDLEQKAVVLGSLVPGLDIRRELRLSESGAGQLSLKRGKSDTEIVRLEHPLLGGTRAAAFASDLSWIALSNAARANVWSIETGTGYVLAPFEHADFLDGHIFRVATAVKPEQRPAVVDIDLGMHTLEKSTSLPDDAAKPPVRFWNGGMRIVVDQADDAVTYRASAEPGKEVWSGQFRSVAFPARNFSPRYIALLWSAGSPDAAKIIKANPQLKQERRDANWDAWLIQIRDSASGKVEGQRLLGALQGTSVAVENHVLQKSAVALAGDWLIVPEPGNRLGMRLVQRFRQHANK